jgi:tryptophan 2,3-dioxygenase
LYTSSDYSHAEKLKQELTQPLFNKMLKKWVGTGELDYERYLHTGTLLDLQSPEGERVSHDELMFQIVHQSQELYLKLASRELVEVVADLDRDALWAVVARLPRVHRILQGISNEMAILETMTPAEYQVIRRSLGNGSGQESPGYNTLRHAAGGLEEALERLLARRGVTLFQVYSAGGPADLRHVCENLVNVDEAFQGWLYAHFQLVRRTIGIDRTVKALDGLPSQVLQARMSLPLFRGLWDVRVELTAGWKREGGYAPGEARPAGGGCPMMMDARQEEAVMQAQATNAAVAHGAYVPAPQAVPAMPAAIAQMVQGMTPAQMEAAAAACPHAAAALAAMNAGTQAHAEPAPHVHADVPHAQPAAHAHPHTVAHAPHTQPVPHAVAHATHVPHGAHGAHAQPTPHAAHVPHAQPLAHGAHASVPHGAHVPPAPHAQPVPPAPHPHAAHAHASVPHGAHVPPAPHAQPVPPAPHPHAAHAHAHPPHTHAHAPTAHSAVAHALAYAHAQELRSQP